MNELNDVMDGAEDEPVSELSDWIGRVTDASRDFESVGPEMAADLGL